TAGTRLGKMGQFFARLSEQMSSSTLAEPVVYDALTVLAALVHAGRPLTLGTLVTALDWPRDRLTPPLAPTRLHPAIADPLVLRTTNPETYPIPTRPDRLSPAQRQALEDLGHANRASTSSILVTRHGTSRPDQTATTVR